MVRGFTFLDPVFFGGVPQEVAAFVYVNNPSEGSFLELTFFGTHQRAFEYQAGAWATAGFQAGAASLILRVQAPVAETTATDLGFHQGTHFLALRDYGTAGADAAAASGAFHTGEHALKLIISGSGAYDLSSDEGAGAASFLTGRHAEIRVPQSGTSTPGEPVRHSTAFETGDYLRETEGDGKAGGYVLRVVLIQAGNTGQLLYADSGILEGHLFDVGGTTYAIAESAAMGIVFTPVFQALSGTYQVLTTPPAPTPDPEPPPPGTITVGSLVRDEESHLLHAASFQGGVHFFTLVNAGSEQDLAPQFATFLSGRHAYMLETAGLDDGQALAAATFSSGSHTQILVIPEDALDGALPAATFQSGVHSEASPSLEATADTTAERADRSNPSLDTDTLTLDTTATTLDGARTTDRGVAHFDDAQGSPTLDEDLYRWSEQG